MRVVALFKRWGMTLLFTVFAVGSIMSVVAPVAVSAETPAKAVPAPCATNTFLTFPAWYRGVVAADCSIVSPASLPGGLPTFIWMIVLNVVEIGLQLVGYIAVGYIFYGGFLFLTSTGSSEGMTKARTTIQNAVIGLVISIASIGIVNLIMGVIV